MSVLPVLKSSREQRPDLGYHPAAFEVAVAVVDALEVIDVDHDKGEVPAGAHLPAGLLFKFLQKHPVVEQAPSVRRPSRVERFFKELRLFKSRRYRVGKGPEKVEVLHAEMLKVCCG